MLRPVSLSFTKTLDLVAEGKLTEEDLPRAIFCFGSGRSWAVEQDADFVLRYQAKYQAVEIKREILDAVRRHVVQAETDGRTIWRFGRPSAEFCEELNDALKRAGLQPFRYKPDEESAIAEVTTFLALGIWSANRRGGDESEFGSQHFVIDVLLHSASFKNTWDG